MKDLVSYLHLLTIMTTIPYNTEDKLQFCTLQSISPYVSIQFQYGIGGFAVRH